MSYFSHIKGAESLINKLEAINDDFIPDFLEKACLMVERDAKILCPVDDGTLRASITHEVDGKEGRVGTNVEYAPYVHQGTGIYAAMGDGRQERWGYQDAAGEWHSTIGQQPNPFLEKALMQNKKEIKKMLKETIEGAVKHA